MAIEPGLYRLMAWLSPSYPVGAFSYSHGIKCAVETHCVTNAMAARDWIGDLVSHGGGFADAAIVAAANRTASAETGWREIAEFAASFVPTSELRLESFSQGNAFLLATRKAWPCPALDRLAEEWPGPYAYPLVVGAAAAGHGIPEPLAVSAYLHAFAANLVSAAVRLVPLGQSDGQQVIADLEPIVADAAERALSTPPASLGTSTLLSDIASMQHETQYSRLFRS